MQSLAKQQRGGTFMGLLLGLVVGLVCALAIAVYVTKVPIPFVNKTQGRTPDQNAAEALKNKNWDPNSPLYGKTPIRPLEPASSADNGGDSTTTANPTATTPQVLVPVVVPPAVAASAAASAPVRSKPKSADPLGDLAKAKAKAAADGTAPPAADKPAAAAQDVDGAAFTYFVQVGAYHSPEEAEAQRGALALLNMDSKVTEREQAGRTVYRVRIGPFSQRTDAEQARDSLIANGTNAVLVRVQR